MLGLDRTLSPDTPFQHDRLTVPHAVMHRHACYELLYLESGELSLWADGRTEKMVPGTFALFVPGVLHACETTGDTATADVWMWQSELLPDLTALLSDRFPYHAVFTLPDGDKERFLAGLAQADASTQLRVGTPARRKKKADRTPTLLPADLLVLRGTLYTALADFFRAEHMMTRSKRILLLEEIVAYVEAGYRYPISMTVLADKLGYERHYLSRFFRASVSLHFTTYVDSYRVEEAMDLLRRTGLPMATVARHCGFGSVRTFDRVFLKMTGQTPTAYRLAVSAAPADASNPENQAVPAGAAETDGETGIGSASPT